MTPKQKQLLQFIIDYQRKHQGVSPSYEEMRIAMGLNSKNGIARLTKALLELGYIYFPKGRVRSINVLCRPGKTPKPPVKFNGSPLIRFSEHLAERLGVDEADVRKALMELPS